MPMSQATVLILGMATIGDLLSWRRSRVTWPFGVEQIAMVAAVCGAYMLVSAPVAYLGSATSLLGEQWDLQLYLPLTEYLKNGAVGAAIGAPPNPLIQALNAVDVRGGSGWGVSYLDAFMGVVLGRPSVETFTSTLDLVFSLSALSVYLFCRRALRLSPKVSLTASGIWASNGLALWLTSVGFAGHVATFLTMPFALATAITALTHRNVRAYLLAGIAAAGMLLSYYTGALLVYSVALAILLLRRLLRGFWHIRQDRRTVLFTIAFVILFASVGHAKFLQVLPAYFTQGSAIGPSPYRHISLSEALGLVPFLRDSGIEPLGVTTWVLDVLGLAAGGILVGMGLVASGGQRWRSHHLMHIVAAIAAVACVFRFIVPYEYGYFKVISLGSFLFSVGLAMSLSSLWDGVRVRLLRGGETRYGVSESVTATLVPVRRGLSVPRLRAGVAAATALLLVLTVITATWTVYALSNPRDRELSGDIARWMDLERQLPEGSPVLISGSEFLSTRQQTLLFYALISHPVELGNLAGC